MVVVAAVAAAAAFAVAAAAAAATAAAEVGEPGPVDATARANPPAKPPRPSSMPGEGRAEGGTVGGEADREEEAEEEAVALPTEERPAGAAKREVSARAASTRPGTSSSAIGPSLAGSGRCEVDAAAVLPAGADMPVSPLALGGVAVEAGAVSAPGMAMSPEVTGAA